jgi:hypothetical protein
VGGPGTVRWRLEVPRQRRVVRVAAADSLNLTNVLTLTAWVRPSESQSGWRTVLERQPDSYFLSASDDSHTEVEAATDDALIALLVGATLCFCLLLAWGSPPAVSGLGRPWWLLVALFLAGSLVDAAHTPSGTLAGPILVASWCGLTASNRVEAAALSLLTTFFVGMTIASLVGHHAAELAPYSGGGARSMALGLLFVSAGSLAARALGAAPTAVVESRGIALEIRDPLRFTRGDTGCQSRLARAAYNSRIANSFASTPRP